MKKLTMLMLTFLLALSAQAAILLNGNANTVNLQIDRSSEKVITRTLALPGKKAVVVVKSCVVESFDKEGNLLKSESNLTKGAELVKITNSFVQRELFGHTLQVTMEDNHDGVTTKIKNLEVEIKALPDRSLPTEVSAAFVPVYQSLVDNYESSYLKGLPNSNPRMLIIAPAALSATLQPFVAWKNEKGIQTEVVNMETIGTTNAQIKSFVANYYNDLNKRPDYLLLVGDVDQPYNMPAFYYSAENDVSDLPYTLVEGSDYFPEIIVGRFSVDSNTELQTVIKKVYSYEKTPYMQNTAWFKKALLVAGNYSDTTPIPTTPTEVSKWLKEKLVRKGFTNVDEIYYAPPEYNSYPGTGEISSSWNSGVSFVSYRGWGNAYGWHYPEFKVEHLDNLSNGFYLPIVTSIVCGTGNFAHTNVDPCFAEKVLRLGTPSAPKGGVGVIAPSDLHTSTKYNNAIFSGFYGGLFDEGIYSFGAAFLRGKNELYRNFPLEHNEGSQVQFYFNVYNLLGDPSMNMWSSVPQTITCSIPDNISIGTNYLDISSNITNGYACAVKNGQIIGRTAIKNGAAVLYFSNNSTDPVKITLTGDNYLPMIKEVAVQSAAAGLTVDNVSGNIVQNMVSDLSIVLKNCGTAASGDLTAVLSSSDAGVTIVQGSQNYGTFSAGESKTQIFKINVAESTASLSALNFSLALSNGKTLKFTKPVAGLNFEIVQTVVNDGNNTLDPGEEREITVTFKNLGTSAISASTASLVALTDAVTVVVGQANFNTVAPQAQGAVTFKVSAKNNAAVGRNAVFNLTVKDANGVKNTLSFDLVIGSASAVTPTGPDMFGYYAYDSFDATFSEKPVYNWQEIDPALGGSGTVFLMKDDEVKTIAMPLNFKYYNVTPDSITLSSNGWVSFSPTKITNFTNWIIPAGLGAYGMVAPYWDDLIGKKVGSTHDKMRVCYKHDAVNHTFIVEWSEAYNNADDVSLEKFQIVFYDPAFYTTQSGNGEIVFNYHTINNVDNANNYATVGIENFEQNKGLLYSYANQYPVTATPLAAGLSIKFTTDAPDPYVGIENEATVSSYALNSYPNPFNNNTLINYQLPTAGEIQLSVINQNGQLVKTLFKGSQNAGRFSVNFNANGLNSGVYFIRLTAPGYTQTMKSLLIK